MNSAKAFYRRLGFERFEDRLLLAIDPLESIGTLRELISSRPAEPAPAEDIAVRFRLELTDTANRPISSVQAGDEFNLNVYVKDQRPRPEGVFAAYLDLNFDAERVERTGEVVFSQLFPHQANTGGTLPGELDEVGAVSAFELREHGNVFPPSAEETLLFEAPFRALESGPVTFRASPADMLPFSDVLLYGVDSSIGAGRIFFDTASLNVIPPASTLQVNGSPAISDSDSTLSRVVPAGSLVSLPAFVLTGRSLLVSPQVDSLLAGFTPTESRSVRLDVRGEASVDPRPAWKARLPSDDARVERSVRRLEPPSVYGGLIELELPAFHEPRRSLGSRSSWGDIPGSGRESSPPNSKSLLDTPDGITRQRVFGRRFLRISWDDLFEAGDASDATSLGGLLDISAIAYETIRAEHGEEGWGPMSLPALAIGDSSDEPNDGESGTETRAIDTLFSLGVELQAARGWRLAIDLAGEQDETGLARSNETTHSEQEADAGPPYPPRQEDGEPAERPT